MDTKREKLIQLKPMLISWLISFLLYVCLIFVEGFIVPDASYYVSIVTFIGGNLLLLNFAIVLVVFPHTFYMPIYMAVSSQLTFIFVGGYLQEYEFYHFLMLMMVGGVSTMKNFKMMAWCVIIMTLINIPLLLYAPRLDWVNYFRFVIHFAFFFYGSTFLLIHTYDVTTKERRSDRAFAAFSAFLDNTPNYMIITDVNNRVRYVSTSTLEFTQHIRREFASGQPLIDLFPDKELKLMFAKILDGKGLYETIIKTNIGGNDKYFRVVSNRLSDVSGDRFIDLSDVTQMEETRQRLAADNASLDSLSRMKTEFLTNISHEMKTPLTIMSGYAELTQWQLNEGASNEDVNENLFIITEEAHRLAQLVERLLSIYGTEDSTTSIIKTYVPDVFSLVLKLCEPIIPTNKNRLNFEIEENCPTIAVNPDILLQVLVNLVSNANRHTSNDTINITANRENENVLFRVCDNGTGIPPELLTNIFKRGLSGNGGTGLGLSICKEVVESRGGTINVESELGNGTTITFTLPIYVKKEGD